MLPNVDLTAALLPLLQTVRDDPHNVLYNVDLTAVFLLLLQNVRDLV